MGKLSPQTNYRVSFSLTLLEFFGPPALVAYTTLRVLLPATKWYIAPVVHFLAILVYWTARVQYTTSVKRADAARRGARLCPEVKGRWPGNVDLMFTYVSDSSLEWCIRTKLMRVKFATMKHAKQLSRRLRRGSYCRLL